MIADRLQQAIDVASSPAVLSALLRRLKTLLF